MGARRRSLSVARPDRGVWRAAGATMAETASRLERPKLRMATDESSLPPKPGRRLCFSLRSLVLFLLLLANILAANRDYPWQEISKGMSSVRATVPPFNPKVVSPRERIVVTANDKGYLSLRNVDTGEPIRQLQSVGKRVCSRLEFTSDGRRLITQYDCEVTLWNAETWKPIRTVCGTVLLIHQVPNRDVWFVLDDASVTSADDGRHVASPENPFRAQTAAFSADSSLLLIGNSGVVRFYSTANWRKLGELRMNVATLIRAFFKPDGSVVTETIDAFYRAPPGFVPPITSRCWRRTAPWGYDSTWYRIELWTLLILAPAFLISLWRDKRDSKRLKR